VATLASPLNAFKIVNTGNVIGAFTEDRDAAIRGELGAKAHMIPVSIAVRDWRSTSRVRLGSRAQDRGAGSAFVDALRRCWFRSTRFAGTNQSTADTSYHVTGEITVRGKRRCR
jgi:hypothetical protein